MRTRPWGRGFSLLELLLALGILSLLLGLAFGAVVFGARIFADTHTRQSLEVQLRTIKLLLERDLEMSDFWLMSAQVRTDPGGKRRDALAVVALSDWLPSTNFEPNTSRPLWDRYVVWYPTTEENSRLIRQLVAPPLPSGVHLEEPLGFSASRLGNAPEGNTDAIYTRILSESVEGLEVQKRFQNGTIQLRLSLGLEGSKRQNSMANTQENFELEMTFAPKNTWPKV